MKRRPGFNLAAGVSAVLFLLMCVVCVWIQRTHVSEGDRLLQELRQVNAELAHEPWTPQYKEHTQRRDAPTRALAEYQTHEAASRAAEFRWYVLLPWALIITFAILPAMWILGVYLRWERRQISRAMVPPTRLQRLWRAMTALLAAGSFALALLVATLWVRSYWVSDRFFFSTFFDEEKLTFWRQTAISFGKGSFGINPIWQSGPKATYRQLIRNIYTRSNRSLDSIPIHTTALPGEPNFNFGPPHWVRWGITYGYFQHGMVFRRPERYAWELIIPIWPVEILLLMIPTIWFWRWNIRRRRIVAGHCNRCGYDLTGNTSGTCPECGSAVATNRGKLQRCLQL